MATFKEKIKSNPRLKALALFMLSPRNQYRPRLWVRLFWNPFKHKKGKGAVIARRARMDVMPYNQFEVGENCLIEDFATINNAVGDVFIGDRTLVGISSIVIGPVRLGKDILIAQHVVLSGLNHAYEDISRPIKEQETTTAPIEVGDNCWLGSNAVIVAGVKVGKHVIVAAGSVVTKDVPDYTVVAGNPARIIKRYNFEQGTWEKVAKMPLEKTTG
ncbi:MAG: acyltransferase [Bacteroidota bacterium]